jgi:hypothetical protein
MAKAAQDPIARLAEYWLRARLMHQLMHLILERYDRDVEKVFKKERLEFETFLTYWLSGLFVVVEGFNKLRLKDVRVQKLFKGHLRYLKAMRHETYHFSFEKGGGDVDELFKQMNWAEELHEAIGDSIREQLNRKVKEEARGDRASKRKVKGNKS